MNLGQATHAEFCSGDAASIVIRCVEYIDKHGLEEIGVYRISGAASVVEA